MSAELLTKRSQSIGHCYYCGGVVYTNEFIAGEYGIRWGHQGCVIEAMSQGRLIRSQYNLDKMPPELNKLIDREMRGKHVVKLGTTERLKALIEKREELQEQRRKRALHNCGHFPPLRLPDFGLPPGMRPRPHRLEMGPGLGVKTVKELVEEVWQKQLEKHFSPYKNSHPLPACPKHVGTEYATELVLIRTNSNYRRELWMHCKGKESK